MLRRMFEKCRMFCDEEVSEKKTVLWNYLLFDEKIDKMWLDKLTTNIEDSD